MTLTNAIMETGSKDRPPMLSPGTYVQWKSKIQEKQALIDVEDEAIHIILTGINNDIYSTVDACDTAQEMWIAIERLKKCENINRQDVEKKLFCEFGYIGKWNNRQKGKNENQRAVVIAGNRESVGQRMVQRTGIKLPQGKDVDVQEGSSWGQLSAEEYNRLIDSNEEPKDQELEAHHTFMENIQEVILDAVQDSGPSYDTKPLGKVHTNDEYNVFPTDQHHTKQPKFINDTYVMVKDDKHVTPNSTDMCSNEGEVDQDAEKNNDERVLISTLIANLKHDIDEKKRNKYLKQANMILTLELEKHKHFHTNFKEKEEAERQRFIALIV
ncbi:hypothetical protein Tco_1320984 [Tanacetum coccineum]